MNRLQKLQTITIFIFIPALYSCSETEKTNGGLTTETLTETLIIENIQQTQVKYAEGFTVEHHDGYKVVHVAKPWPDATDGMKYVLVQKGKQVPENLQGGANH